MDTAEKGSVETRREAALAGFQRRDAGHDLADEGVE